ncbi:hypothetical protein B7494_g3367 [Chlorociboria aeruginascens]|nr:hypothetical protein B7494_g3367 [Chlorociboria aeruginascens]
MFTPRLRTLLRPATNRGPQCLRQPRIIAAPRIAIQHRTITEQQQARPQKRRPEPRTDGSASQAAKALFKRYPFSMSLAAFMILSAAGCLMYVNYVYHSYFVGAFHKFPEPVAKQLRKALYYTNISLEPKKALGYYKEALRVADEVGMDPFSDEIIGVKIQLAAMLEKIQQYEKAIHVLEIVKSDCLEWIEQLGGKEGNTGKRTKVLAKTVGISVKLGELYANDYVKEKEAAEESLVWAVETVLREQQRREKEGVKPGEGDWVTPEESGGALEVNNLSISLAQQNPPITPGQPSISRPALISNAQEWAKKAISTTAKITPPERTEECDIGCAVATYNLGEFAEMDGDIAEARKKYEEAGSLAKALGFKEGVMNSDKALKRLSGSMKT